jgi:hypothetical protein
LGKDLSRRVRGGEYVRTRLYLLSVVNVYGFLSESRTSGTTPVIMLHENPGRFSLVWQVVPVFIGNSGIIGMDRVYVE